MHANQSPFDHLCTIMANNWIFPNSFFFSGLGICRLLFIFESFCLCSVRLRIRLRNSFNCRVKLCYISINIGFKNCLESIMLCVF